MLNKRFTKLVVIEQLDFPNNSWKCLCDCGNTRIVSENKLLRGEAKSCGCLQRKKKDTNLVGQKFNYLLVIKKTYSKRLAPAWLCKCDCGNEVILETSTITTGNNLSCGKCLKQIHGDLTGKQFKHWTVVSRIPSIGPSKWLCKCVCGTEKSIWASNLTSNKAIGHCGCITRAQRTEIQNQRTLLRRMRNAIIKRDNFTCMLCGVKPLNYKFKVHHIFPFKEYPELRLKATNLVTLCPKCHCKAHNGNFNTINKKIQTILSAMFEVGD